AIGQHPAQRGGGWLDAEPQETERRLEDDGAAQLQRGDDDDRTEDVGKDVSAKYGHHRQSHGEGAFHERLFSHGEGASPGDAGVLYPTRQCDYRDDAQQTRADERYPRDGDEDRRKRQLDVDQAHDQRVEAASEVISDDA